MDIILNIKESITIEEIINGFSRITDIQEEYNLKIILYKYVLPESLAIVVAFYRAKVFEGYNINVNIPNINTYAQRIDFHKNMGIEEEENFNRYSSEGRFIEITNFNEENSIKLVNNIMKIFRNNIDLEDSVFRVLNYCFLEVVDNVHNHSQSPIGGYLTAQRFPTERMLCITIIDCGRGIYKSLTQNENSEYKHLTESEAMEYCIKESVTNGNGMGNGLYHTRRFIELNNGKMTISSGRKKLIVTQEGIEVVDIPNFNGTIVSLCIKLDNQINFNEIFYGNIPTSVEEADDCINELW